ncbi:odorant receptor Or1-like [Arctopsyche grandis]|uniref:odorant receptor Or1-like n=1 Tax=Arctopsyche grandis TaxID=121162 RepID=UPI00406D68B2
MTISLCLTCLTYTGFWPPSNLNGWKLKLYYCYTTIVFIFLLGIYIVIQIVDLWIVWGDIPLMTADAFLLFTNLCQAFKMINILLRHKNIEEIINLSDNLIKEYDMKEKKVIVKKYSNLAVKYLIFYFSITYIVNCLWALGPIITHTKKLPFAAWYPYDIEKSPAYELTYLHQTVAIIIAASLNIMKDSLVTGLMNKAACQMELLKYSLENISNNVAEKSSDFPSILYPDSVVYRLKLLVIRHTKILHMIKQIEECFGSVIMVQFSISLIIICVSAFYLGEAIRSGMVNFLASFLYLSAMIFQLFIFCWHGNEIEYHSEQLVESAYFCSWYSHCHEFNSILLIFMIQSTRIINLKAFGVVAISIKTFMGIIKTSYSLFTLLQQANNT